MRRVIEAYLQSHPGQERFDYQQALDPVGNRRFDNGTQFAAFVERYMEQEIARRRAQRQKMSPQEVEGIVGQYVAFSTYNPFPRLSSIHLPTQITVGSEDNVTPPRYSEDLHAQIPGSELVVFPGAPHRTLKFARDEFNRITLKFLLQRAGKTTATAQ